MEQESLTSKSSPILSRRDGTRGVVNGVGGIVEGEEAEDEEGVSVSASDSFTKILEETVSCHASEREGRKDKRWCIE